MNIEYYKEFLQFQNKGLKKQASESVSAFISSFKNEDDISTWVWSNLQELETNCHCRIRYELFNELIYPVLKVGYLNNDFNSTLWLGKIIQNLYQNPELHKELEYVSEYQLFKKCLKRQPNNQEVRELLLDNIVKGLLYCVHEWPSGILYDGNNGATLEQCQKLKSDVEFAIELDTQGCHTSFLEDFTTKLAKYEARLNK